MTSTLFGFGPSIGLPSNAMVNVALFWRSLSSCTQFIPAYGRLLQWRFFKNYSRMWERKHIFVSNFTVLLSNIMVKSLNLDKWWWAVVTWSGLHDFNVAKCLSLSHGWMLRDWKSGCVCVVCSFLQLLLEWIAFSRFFINPSDVSCRCAAYNYRTIC